MPAFSLGVVVVNWNGSADTLACLDSLRAAAPQPARVVVVDNASTDGSVEALRRWLQSGAPMSTSILASAENRGFAIANNLGVAYLAQDATLTHFLLLNNDATVSPSFFAELGRAVEARPDAALLGPTIYEAGQPERIWYAGGRFLLLRSLVKHLCDRGSGDGRPVVTEFVTGCALVIARTAWETLGPLPDCYFIYMEDAEYSYRAKVAGLPVIHVPRAVAYHAVGGTVRRAVPSARIEYWKARNRALFVRRNLHGWIRWGALIYLIITKPARAVRDALQGRGSVGWAVFRGTVRGLLGVEGDGDAVRTPRT